VPTLDVDLAWHTHQLSPRAYYAYTVGNCGRFVDHDDKVPEDKLSEEFAWTTKRYQELFGEAYSECTCWYCEAIQATTEVKTGKFGFFQIVDKKQEGGRRIFFSFSLNLSSEIHHHVSCISMFLLSLTSPSISYYLES